MMTPIEFARLVYKMRNYQRAYFRTKHPQDLREAKYCEFQVDAELDCYTRKAKEDATQIKIDL